MIPILYVMLYAQYVNQYMIMMTVFTSEQILLIYPDHPHRSQRQPCSAILLKKVKTEKSILYGHTWLILINLCKILFNNFMRGKDFFLNVRSGETEQFKMAIYDSTIFFQLIVILPYISTLLFTNAEHQLVSAF